MAETGRMSVQLKGDFDFTDKMIDGLLRAFDANALTYNFLQDRVHPILKERAERRFDSGGDEAVGGAWAALQPATIEIRQQKGYGAGPINVRTGAMRRWVVDQGADVTPIPGVGGNMFFPNRSVSGDMVKKMTTAQTGDKSSRTVARPVLGVSALDMELVLVALGVHIAENQANSVTGIF